MAHSKKVAAQIFLSTTLSSAARRSFMLAIYNSLQIPYLARRCWSVRPTLGTLLCAPGAAYTLHCLLCLGGLSHLSVLYLPFSLTSPSRFYRPLAARNTSASGGREQGSSMPSAPLCLPFSQKKACKLKVGCKITPSFYCPPVLETSTSFRVTRKLKYLIRPGISAT